MFLAKNYVAKVMVWGKQSLKNKIRSLKSNEMKVRMRKPRGRGIVIIEAWRRVKKNRGIIKRNLGYKLYEENYWNMTNKVEGDVCLGEERKNNEIYRQRINSEDYKKV